MMEAESSWEVLPCGHAGYREGWRVEKSRRPPQTEKARKQILSREPLEGM